MTDFAEKAENLEMAAACYRLLSRCPFCGHPEYTEIQEHGHYRTECCKQITTGCCNGEQE